MHWLCLSLQDDNAVFFDKAGPKWQNCKKNFCHFFSQVPKQKLERNLLLCLLLDNCFCLSVCLCICQNSTDSWIMTDKLQFWITWNQVLANRGSDLSLVGKASTCHDLQNHYLCMLKVTNSTKHEHHILI